MPAPESVVTAAIAQIEQGFAVFALKADAKVPVTEHGFKNATTRPDWIRRQLEAPAAGNYGLVWPATSSEPVVVFYLDDGGGADRPWRDRMLDLVARHGPLPATKITATPSGGRHAFYRWPTDVAICDPSPGHENVVSVSTAAPITVPKSMPISVTTGSMALRSPWRNTTVRSVRPFARAVRM